MTVAEVRPHSLLQQINNRGRIAGPIANIISYTGGKTLGRVLHSHEISLTRDRCSGKRASHVRAGVQPRLAGGHEPKLGYYSPKSV